MTYARLVSFQSKMDGSAKHRHCRSRQHRSCLMMTSLLFFPPPGGPGLGGFPGHRVISLSRASCYAPFMARTAGNNRTAKAPK